MSSIRSAVSKVKNFFVGITQNPEGDESNQGSNRLARGLFGSASTRKRVASNDFEPEITDDEDDTPGFPLSSSSPVVKRIRIQVDPDHPSMASSSKYPYPTRGSGIPPGVEGKEKQPWEFDFSFRKKNVTADDPRPGPSSRVTRDASKLSLDSRSLTKRHTETKDIEVITLDEDVPSENQKPPSEKQSSSLILSPRRREMALHKPRLSTTIKRDSNRFTKSFVGGLISSTTSSALRMAEMEKNKYKRLLMNYNIINEQGSYQSFNPLSRSKVTGPDLRAMYQKFGNSPSSGAVTFQKDGQDLSSFKSSMGSPLSKALVPTPKLYSTPHDASSTFSATYRPSTILKAITYKGEPEVIDITAPADEVPWKEPSASKCISPITPVSSRKNHQAPSPVLSPVGPKFTNLQDALDKSILPEDIQQDEPEKEILALEYEHKEEPSQDLSIIAERIVEKSKRKSVNTLELEQTSCPYVKPQWLGSTISSWRDNQKSREDRIHAEKETLKVLKRESTLEKELEERIRKKLTLTEIIVLEEPEEEGLPELTDEIVSIINNSKRRGNDAEVLAKVALLKDTISITRGDIKTLGPGQWLNDNVINTYLGLIVLRSKEGKFPSVYTFQTFFYPKLMKEGYSNSLKRWTRKDDIFAHDLIILPIHLGLHWCLACIDLRKCTIKYYDSLGGDNNKCLSLLLEYITREMKERKQKDLDKSQWTLENVKGIPQQQNGSDCGMFSCKFAEYLSRDKDFTFTQDNMPYYRDRMIYELVASNLLYP